MADTRQSRLTIQFDKANDRLRMLVESGEAIASRMASAASDYVSISDKAQAHLNEHDLLQRQVVPYETLPPVHLWGNGPALTEQMTRCQTAIKSTWAEFEDWKTQAMTFLDVAFGGSGNAVLKRFAQASASWYAPSEPRDYIEIAERSLGHGISSLRAVRQELEFYANPPQAIAAPSSGSPDKPGLLTRISAHPALNLTNTVVAILILVGTIVLIGLAVLALQR